MSKTSLVLVLIELIEMILHLSPVMGYIPVRSVRTFSYCGHLSTTLHSSNKRNDEDNNNSNNNNVRNILKDNMNPLTRASWYGVEIFGKVFGNKSRNNNNNNNNNNIAIISPDKLWSSSNALDLSKPPSSLQETLERIKLDNDRNYFLSGEVDQLIYDKNCLFADPFVSFRGRDRFVDNLQNLGSFITKYSAKLLEYTNNDSDYPSTASTRKTTTTNTAVVNTKLMVKLELNLPWKPVLAWPWGVTYRIDKETFLVTEHMESWDIEPWEGVKQIFRKPTLQIK